MNPLNDAARLKALAKRAKENPDSFKSRPKTRRSRTPIGDPFQDRTLRYRMPGERTRDITACAGAGLVQEWKKNSWVLSNVPGARIRLHVEGDLCILTPYDPRDVPAEEAKKYHNYALSQVNERRQGTISMTWNALGRKPSRAHTGLLDFKLVDECLMFSLSQFEEIENGEE